MSPTSSSPASLLAFGAHPDDVEFGCGAVIANETRLGRSAHLVVCSYGESGSHGTPEIRKHEAIQAAEHLHATLEFMPLDGDARLSMNPAHSVRLAQTIREVRPSVVLAPSVLENQHPDHWRLGTLVRDAVRIARYGGVDELRSWPPHAVVQLFFYALAPDAEPRDATPILVDVSDRDVIAAWSAAMEAHATQMSTRRYSEFCLMRARINGLRAGVEYAMALYPNDPLVFDSLSQIARTARVF